jgi:hypothetical protein
MQDLERLRLLPQPLGENDSTPYILDTDQENPKIIQFQLANLIITPITLWRLGINVNHSILRRYARYAHKQQSSRGVG